VVLLKRRVIPCLLLKDGGLVKTTGFSNPVYVGDPINAIRIFNDKEVDELMVLDIQASRVGKEPDFALVEKFAGECFMPLCYGGGVRTVSQAQQLFALGVEKVCIQSSALEDMSLIRRIADRFGSQSVLFSIDVRRGLLGGRSVYRHPRTRAESRHWRRIIDEAVQHGAGEVVLNAVDRDGTMRGMDYELIRLGSDGLSVPLVAVGGAGSLADIRGAVDAGASAVGVGAWFVFYGPHRAVLITYPQYEDLVRILEA
jgi:cyclase